MSTLVEAVTAADSAALGGSTDSEVEALQAAVEALIEHLPEPLRLAVTTARTVPGQATAESRIAPARVPQVARDLASDRGENPEYDRALVEMACALLGCSGWYADGPEAVTALLLGRDTSTERPYEVSLNAQSVRIEVDQNDQYADSAVREYIAGLPDMAVGDAIRVAVQASDYRMCVTIDQYQTDAIALLLDKGGFECTSDGWVSATSAE